MRIPGFTAEASIENIKEGYALTLKARTKTGNVQPQGLFVNPNGDLVYCDNYVGCIVVRHKLKHTLM